MALADGTSHRDMSNHLERIRRTGKIEEAALIDFNGAVIISSSGMTISTGEAGVIVHTLESTYNSLTKLNVGNKTFTCFRCDMCCPALIGRSENDLINIYKCADFIVVAVSDPESPGSCIYEMTKFIKRYNRQSSSNSVILAREQADDEAELTEIITDDRDEDKLTTSDKDRVNNKSNTQDSHELRTVIHPSEFDFKVSIQRDSYSDIDLAASDESESFEEKPYTEDTHSNLSENEGDVTHSNIEMKQIVKDTMQDKHGETNAAFETNDEAAVNIGQIESRNSAEATETDLNDVAVSVLASATETNSKRDSGADDMNVSLHELKHTQKHDNHVRFSMEIDEYSDTVGYDEPDNEAFC